MQCSAGGEIIIMKGEEREGEGNPWMDGPWCGPYAMTPWNVGNGL